MTITGDIGELSLSLLSLRTPTPIQPPPFNKKFILVSKSSQTRITIWRRKRARKRSRKRSED